MTLSNGSPPIAAVSGVLLSSREFHVRNCFRPQALDRPLFCQERQALCSTSAYAIRTSQGGLSNSWGCPAITKADAGMRGSGKRRSGLKPRSEAFSSMRSRVLSVCYWRTRRHQRLFFRQSGRVSLVYAHSAPFKAAKLLSFQTVSLLCCCLAFNPWVL
ncbi:hypothetical protein VTI28DRAFT_797 [Corynascus sepedonium]